MLLHTSSSTIVPLYKIDGIPKIKLQPTFTSGTIGIGEFYSLNGISSDSTIGLRETVEAMSFMGGDGNTIVHMAEIEASFSRYRPHCNELAIGWASDIYDVFQNGIMFVPGRLGNDFPQDTEISMVLNPENSEIYCQPESQFFLNLGFNYWDFRIVAAIVSPNQSVSFTPRTYRLVTNQVYDTLPSDLFDQLIERITDTNMEAPFTITDCNFERYPSIQFGFVTFIDGHSVPSGNIIYGPDDYLQRISETRCILNIRRALGNDGLFGTNFLSKIAIHLTRNRIGFCDPIDPPSIL